MKNWYKEKLLHIYIKDWYIPKYNYNNYNIIFIFLLLKNDIDNIISFY